MDFYESIIQYDLEFQKNLSTKIDKFLNAVKNLDYQKQNTFHDENYNKNINEVLQEINTSYLTKNKLFPINNRFPSKKEYKSSIKYIIFAKDINDNTTKNNYKNTFNQKLFNFDKEKEESTLKNDINKIVLDTIEQNVKNMYLKKINEKFSMVINNSLKNNYIKISNPINNQATKVKRNNNNNNINKIKRSSIDCNNIRIQNGNKFQKINAKNNNNNDNSNIPHHLNIQKLHIKNIKVKNNNDSFNKLLKKENKKINIIKVKCQKENNNNISNVEQEEDNKIKVIEQKNNNSNKSIQNISDINYYNKTNNLNSCRMKKVNSTFKNNRNKSNNNKYFVDNRKNNFDILKNIEKKNRVYSGGVREDNYYIRNDLDYNDTHCNRVVSNKRGVKVGGKRILSSIVYVNGMNSFKNINNL